MGSLPHLVRSFADADWWPCGAFRVIVRTLKPDQMMVAQLRPEAAAPLPERAARFGEIYGGIRHEIDKQREEQDIENSIKYSLPQAKGAAIERSGIATPATQDHL
jgi:hypothetical protein